MNKLKICNKCKENKKGTFGGYWPYLNEDYNICKECGGKLETINFESDDFLTIRNISTESNFIEAMIDLHDKDIIEYELKMSQFRSQAKADECYDKPKPKICCPKCGSTQIQIVPIKFSFLTGFATNKTNRVCVNCKYKW